MPKSFHVGYVCLCVYGLIKIYITSLYGVCLSIRIGLSLKSTICILLYLKSSINTKVSVNTADSFVSFKGLYLMIFILKQRVPPTPFDYTNIVEIMQIISVLVVMTL